MGNKRKYIRSNANKNFFIHITLITLIFFSFFIIFFSRSTAIGGLNIASSLEKVNKNLFLSLFAFSEENKLH